MRSSLLALGLLGLLGCDETVPAPTTSPLPSLAKPRPYSLDTRTLIADVERWTHDGRLDVKERMEILHACGYRIQASLSWFRGGSYFWSGASWIPLTKDILYDFPLDSLNAGRFLAHYRRP